MTLKDAQSRANMFDINESRASSFASERRVRVFDGVQRLGGPCTAGV
jgi:hypothetical protein